MVKLYYCAVTSRFRTFDVINLDLHAVCLPLQSLATRKCESSVEKNSWYSSDDIVWWGTVNDCNSNGQGRILQFEYRTLDSIHYEQLKSVLGYGSSNNYD